MRPSMLSLMWFVTACTGFRDTPASDENGEDPGTNLDTDDSDTDAEASDTGEPGSGGEGHVTTCGPIVYTERAEADLPGGTSWPALSASTGTREAAGTLHDGAAINVVVEFETVGTFRHGVAEPLTTDAICYDQWDAQVQVSVSVGAFDLTYVGWLSVNETLPLGLGNHFEPALWPASYGLPAAGSQSPRIYMDIHWPAGAGLSGGFRAEPNVPPANGDDGFVSVLSF